MQFKLTGDLDEQKDKLQQQKEKQRIYEAELTKKKQEFEKYFIPCATQVFNKDGLFYFWGDVEHCSEESLFHNVKELVKRLKENKKKYAHMDWNDLPTYSDTFDWEYQEKERKTTYKDELYLYHADNSITKLS